LVARNRTCDVQVIVPTGAIAEEGVHVQPVPDAPDEFIPAGKASLTCAVAARREPLFVTVMV